MLLSGDSALAENGLTPQAPRRSRRAGATRPERHTAERHTTAPVAESRTEPTEPLEPVESLLASESVDAPEAATAPAESDFRTWRKERPFIGGLLVALGGVEMFFSGQLDIGHLHVQLGIEGLQATIIPIALLLLGILAMTMPDHHVFYGVIALAVAVYSLVGVNLGGFLIGMLLAGTGGVLVAAWMRRSPAPQGEPAS
ncbi:hypothetical protein QFZ52_002451 [Arthrobacter woluwensis]|uniref:DUF6114 domain-containing protein n=1 Tax=Arthrobacter woluwensis TaxID=156980 RepID=UPI00278543E9|nr:DUF6114 domain-containing protein [Arthrobacter woluwensis]MDQ0709799.1 hypothetical protein [Arthrobacter woluwensis]